MLSVKQNFAGLYRSVRVHTGIARSSVRARKGVPELRFALHCACGNRPVARTGAIRIVALRRTGLLPLEDSRMNTLAVTALAGLDDGVATPHETLHPFFSSRARARECSALYCELRRVAAIFCNGLNVTERRAPRGVVGLSRGFRCPGVWQ